VADEYQYRTDNAGKKQRRKQTNGVWGDYEDFDDAGSSKSTDRLRREMMPGASSSPSPSPSPAKKERVDNDPTDPMPKPLKPEDKQDLGKNAAYQKALREWKSRGK